MSTWMRTPPPRPVPLTPPLTPRQETRSPYVKMPHDSAVQYNEDALPQEMLVQLLFEDIGGSELINVSRHDTIDGEPINYSLVGNLTTIRMMFNSNNILSGFDNKDTYLNQHSVDIGQRISSVSFNNQGDLVIDLEEMPNDESIEIMILADGMIYTT